MRAYGLVLGLACCLAGACTVESSGGGAVTEQPDAEDQLPGDNQDRNQDPEAGDPTTDGQADDQTPVGVEPDDDEDAATAGLPVVDCSGVPFEETGVNLTPFYESIPAYKLPNTVLGELRPASMDLSESFPPPCHQGQLRSCVAWQVGYGLMSYYASTRLADWGSPDRSDRQFSPPFIFVQANAFVRERSRADSCDRAGTFVSDAMAFIQANGCALMSDVPFQNDLVCDVLNLTAPWEEVLGRASQYKLAYYRKIEADVETTKSYLFEELPPVVVFLVGEVFEELTGDTVYNTFEADGQPHVLVVIGYDDERAAFRILNSWGTFWGDDGYAWVGYENWAEIVAEAWIAAPAFNDGLDELVAGTEEQINPYLDSDGDGLPDTMEREFAERGYDATSADGDFNSALTILTDTDRDAFDDDTELRFGTDPNDADSFPFMPGYEFPAELFGDFDDDLGGILEPDEALLDPTDTSDDDGDGVPGSADLCPDTPAGYFVDPVGCPLEL